MLRKSYTPLSRAIVFLILALLVSLSASPSQALGPALGAATRPAFTPPPPGDQLVADQHPADGPVVARVYYRTRENLNRLAQSLDIWEVRPESGYLVALLHPDQQTSLLAAGYRLEIDPAQTTGLSRPNQALPDQVSGIPGYPCYRTVEETYNTLAELEATYPELVTRVDIGDSWEKVTPSGASGYDIWGVVLTNKAIPGPKPRFFLMGAIHAREYVTAETVTRFVEHLLNNYGSDADATWLLDYYEIHAVPVVNPDGRKKAEAGSSWRKNTDNDDGCRIASYVGTDLNRNSSFHWGGAGASTNPCDDLYRGPSPASEPETQAVQNYVSSIFPDQRGPNIDDPAPLDAAGLFISLHSYSNLILWPWGDTNTPAPNGTQLQTLGRKMAYFNGYTPQQSIGLYATTGATDDWAYGELGLAAYTYEMGTTFFQSCSTFENPIYPDNLKALLYAAKSAHTPYQSPAGPDVLTPVATPLEVELGKPITLTATLDDTRYQNSEGNEPTQTVAAGFFALDTPPWLSETPLSYALEPVDGSFDSSSEAVRGVLDTTGLSVGKHIVFLRGQDAAGNWGAYSAVFFKVLEPTGELLPSANFTYSSPAWAGQPVTFSNLSAGLTPLSFTWDFGDGVGSSMETNPAYTYASSGVYTVTLTASNLLGSSTAQRLMVVQPEPVNVSEVRLELSGGEALYVHSPVGFSLDILPDHATTPFTYTIDYGDGTPAITANSVAEPVSLEHMFAKPGVYTVTVAVRNGNMQSPVTATLKVTVMESPYITFLPFVQQRVGRR